MSGGNRTARGLIRAACTIALIATIESAANGQEAERDPTIANLPRPGYEPRAIWIGQTVVSPVIDIQAQHDDNIFATPTNRAGDTIFDIMPRVTAKRATPGLDLNAKLTADIRRYVQHERENVAAFSAEADGRKLIGKNQSIAAKVGFARLFERRSDPEADTDRARHPSLINETEASLDYRLQGPRIGIAANAAFERLNYLPAADADRDLTNYHGSLRGTIKLTQAMGVYLQGYANRRDARLPFDRSGFDRDTTTIGAIAGISFDLTNKIQGEMGAGFFRANPDDPRLKAYNGLAISGRLTYRPRTRTAVSFDAFRGDVATIRQGALARVDTRLALSVDQEARHNLLLHGAISFRGIDYRGPGQRNQRYYGAEAEARYLISRGISLSLGGNYTRRTADLPNERFRRWQGMLGVRFSY
jgi:hypothetical protein